MKGFIIEKGDSAVGPWTQIVEGEFSDPSQEEDITIFPLSEPKNVRFLNFRCVSWWRSGCLLQYIGALYEEVVEEGKHIFHGLAFSLTSNMR